MNSGKVGILGGGQLARMLALAGYPLGLEFRVFDPAPDAPAAHVAEHVIGDYDDYRALERFADGLQVATYEFENVPFTAARHVSESTAVHPNPDILSITQDRLREKAVLQRHGIPTAPFASVRSLEELHAAIETIGLPAVLKTCRFGYDGKGQRVLHEKSDIRGAWRALGKDADLFGLILEGFVPFTRELSILAVRGKRGETAFYPLVENHHHEGILRLSIAPAPGITPQLQKEAEGHALRVMEIVGYVGVLAIELFQVGDKLLANEMAPRVHNSGHWTIEGADTSQFENHLRAILGMPLGSTTPRGHAAMLNIIGRPPDTKEVLSIPGAHLHIYGKKARKGRKLGHITLVEDNAEMLENQIEKVRGLLR